MDDTMRWAGRRQSGNVEDRRGMGRAGAVGGGIGSIVLVLVLSLVFGVDPRQLLVQAPQGGGGVQQFSPEQEKLKEFVGVVLADTEDVWNDQFQRMGRDYREPKLVLFTGSVESACGHAGSAV